MELIRGQKIVLVQGDARRIPLADESVQCCITSPPYWSLRDYGIAPSVWGGEASCEHQWGPQLTNHEGGPQGNGGQRADRDVSAQNAAQRTIAGQFCAKCGAWFGCLGLEPTPELYVEHQVIIFREVRRVLRSDGTLWLNIGDSYNANPKGSDGNKSTLTKQAIDAKRIQTTEHFRNRPLSPNLKPKDLVGIPWMLAFALRADGWYLRQEIIWAKPNPMPESVGDRCTKAHEQLFLLTKNARYFYDADAIREPVTSTGGASIGAQTKIKVPNGRDTSKGNGGHGGFHRDGRGETEYKRLDAGHIDVGGIEIQSRKFESADQRNHPLGRNKRSVWFISTQSFPEAHFATYPIKLVNPCIKAGTSEKGCCPRCGAPWKRIVERVNPPAHNGDTQSAYEKGSTANRLALLRQSARERGAEYVNARVTTHWLPSCKCSAGEPVPCIVLDCFNGAATTGVAAKLLGRSYVGIEPKAEYLDISRRRLDNAKHGKIKRKRPRTEKPEATLFEPMEAVAQALPKEHLKNPEV